MKYLYLIILYALAVAYSNLSTEVVNVAKNNKQIKTFNENSAKRLPASVQDETITSKLKKCFSN